MEQIQDKCSFLVACLTWSVRKSALSQMPSAMKKIKGDRKSPWKMPHKMAMSEVEIVPPAWW
eukprot:4134034-Ditylum_brightwellii.AAC.1